MSRRSLSALIALVVIYAGCKESTGLDGTPTTIELVTPPQATGFAAAAVAPTPMFVVKNERGQPMGGVAVTITASMGGAVTGAPEKTLGGPTSVGTWTLSSAVGTNTLTIAVAGLQPLVITVEGVIGPPAVIAVVGSPPTAPANTDVTNVRVAVRDQAGNGVADQPVTFSVIAGGGSLAATSGTTNANGEVTIPTWRFGKSAVPQVVRATSGSITADVTGTVQTSYNIVVRFYGPAMTQTQRDVFQAAAARIMGVVTGDLPAVQATNLVVNTPETCNVTGQANLNETIDDIIIFASAPAIDGPGNILGRAGPCYVRNTSNITVVGVMEFDSADLNFLAQQGILQDVITHEMLHVLGIGSLWETMGLLTGKNTADPRYTGEQGRQGCLEVGGTIACANSVPVEGTPAEAGTINTHWRESVFDAELMTGFAEGGNPPPPMPLSKMSVRSLVDLGYTINAANFDDYSIFLNAMRRGPAAPDIRLREQVGHLPIHSIDRNGRVRFVRGPQ